MPAPDTLLIDLGDIGSLTLLFMQADPTRLILWHPGTSRAGAEARLTAVRAHASIIGEDRLVIADALPQAAPGATESDHLAEAQTILRACSAAMHLNCSRILWPGHVGDDHIGIAGALERLNTIAHLADPAGSLIIDAPMIDLADVEIVDLADDSGAPMRAFWPCKNDGENPCGSCDGCARWMSAFDQADVRWPWMREHTIVGAGGVGLRAGGSS